MKFRHLTALCLGAMMTVTCFAAAGCDEGSGGGGGTPAPEEPSVAAVPEGYVAEGANAFSPEEEARMFDIPDAEYLYNYCPSIMQVSATERYIWYCTNLHDMVIDAIGYRHGVKYKGTWYWSPEEIALAPSEETLDLGTFDFDGVGNVEDDVPWDNGAWDRRHTCDPTVVKGKFNYKDKTYSYLMAYLGCYVADRDNEIGLAVAENPAGPWTRVEYAADPSEDENHVDGLVSARNPWTRRNRAFIRFDEQFEEYYQNDLERLNGKWGVGQPSMVSVDKAGKVLLFYTVNGGIGRVVADRWDLSDLEHPVLEKRETLVQRGITNYTNEYGTWACTNSDLAYDPVKDRFYMIGDGFPFLADEPSYIAAYSYLGFLRNTAGEGSVLGDCFFGEPALRACWNEVDFIDEYRTGYARNHNCGLVRDEYGWIPDPDTVEVGVTASTAGSDFGYTYRISRYALDVSKL